MEHDKANAALETVYAARSSQELVQSYADWAVTYDGETAALGYLLPFLITAWVARYVPRGDGPLLDVGCGTGLSGPSLKGLGYDDLAHREKVWKAFGADPAWHKMRALPGLADFEVVSNISSVLLRPLPFSPVR